MAKRKRSDTTQGAAPDAHNVLRVTNSLLSFRKQCGNPACKRKRECAGDAKACFDRFWPPLPERLKVEYRAFIMAHAKGRTMEEALLDAEAEAARYDAVMGKTAAASPLATSLSPRPLAGARSPDGAQRNPGPLDEEKLPHSALLHADYKRAPRLRTL